MLEFILDQYGITAASAQIVPFGNGLINHTWMIRDNDDAYILQKINHRIFKEPELIAQNIRMISTYLAANAPGYLFPAPLQTNAGEEMVIIPGEGYYRLFPFVKGSHTIDVVKSPEEAFEAAFQFGRFTSSLKTFGADQLQITLPDFHNLPLRYIQFEDAVKNGNKERIKEAAELIKFLKQQYSIAATGNKIRRNSDFRIRVTHHDTKISNVLFDARHKGLCVIDLDTVMPGNFISDTGDMMRTYLSPVSEEETDFSLIEVRSEFFKAIAEGYMNEMSDELTFIEKQHFVYSGKFMIYMQALRFLTDFLNNDVYYGAKYEGHNFLRAQNQAVLLKKLIEQENDLIHLLP